MSATLHRTEGYPPMPEYSDLGDSGASNYGYSADDMRAYVDADRAVRWQPIETAPRLNGQRVLLLRDAGNGPFHAIGYALDGLPGWCSAECRGIETLEELGYRVTHWMPLPPSPNQGEAS